MLLSSCTIGLLCSSRLSNSYASFLVSSRNSCRHVSRSTSTRKVHVVGLNHSAIECLLANVIDIGPFENRVCALLDSVDIIFVRYLARTAVSMRVVQVALMKGKLYDVQTLAFPGLARIFFESQTLSMSTKMRRVRDE